MMDYASNMLVMVTMVFAAVSMLRLVTAKTIVVGGAIGWDIPPTATTYSDWASNQTFMVNDVLEFDFITGGHTVAEVTKAAYDGCNTKAIIKLHTLAPVKITLTTAGPLFFLCGVPGHCVAGQKLAINVTGGSSLPPTPSPAPSMATKSASTKPTGGSYSNQLLPSPIVHLMLIVVTGLMLIFI